MVKAKKIDQEAFTNIVDKHEITVIIDEEKLDEENVIEIMRGWKIFTLDIAFPPTFCGVTARIADALAKENISIMPIAAFTRDHFVIAEKNMERAKAVFEGLGIRVSE